MALDQPRREPVQGPGTAVDRCQLVAHDGFLLSIGQADKRAAAALERAPVDHGGCGDVLQRDAAGIEKDDLAFALSTGLAPGHDLAELGVHLAAGHDARVQRMVQIADRRALLEAVDDHPGGAEQGGIDFLLVLVVGADGGDEAARRYPGVIDDVPARRGARHAKYR